MITIGYFCIHGPGVTAERDAVQVQMAVGPGAEGSPTFAKKVVVHKKCLNLNNIFEKIEALNYIVIYIML